MKRLLVGLGALTLAACGLVARDDKAVYVLVDVSGTYYAELDKATRGAKFLAAALGPGDRLVVAEIGSCSFDDGAVALDARLPDRPSAAAAAKREALAEIDAYRARAARSQYTDIDGALLQAVDALSREGARNRTIVIYSDLVTDLAPGCSAERPPIDLTGVRVVAANVIKLRSDAVDPAQYFARLRSWEERVTQAGGTWALVDDAEGLRDAVAG